MLYLLALHDINLYSHTFISFAINETGPVIIGNVDTQYLPTFSNFHHS